MDARICQYASGFVLLASLGMAGCDNHPVSRGIVTGPSPLTTGPSPLTADVVTVEPVTVVPVFLSTPFCAAVPLFQAGFTLVIRANQQLIINGFGFEFLDGFGVRSVPTLISTSSTIGPFVPVPLPTSSPIPIPGVTMSPGSSRTLPMLLQFGCGVTAPGTLVVGVITASGGRADVKRVSVRIVG